MTKEEIIQGIKDRIESEFRKHKDLDWAEIAARKIFGGFIKDCNLQNINGIVLPSKARQMRLEQQHKIDSYTEYYNQYEIGTLNGIDRIVKLLERHFL